MKRVEPSWRSAQSKLVEYSNGCGGASQVIIGLVYILLVLFIPYGNRWYLEVEAV
jgi:hypothetical protein